MQVEISHKFCDIRTGSNFISELHIYFPQQYSSAQIRWYIISLGGGVFLFLSLLQHITGVSYILGIILPYWFSHASDMLQA